MGTRGWEGSSLPGLGRSGLSAEETQKPSVSRSVIPRACPLAACADIRLSHEEVEEFPVLLREEFGVVPQKREITTMAHRSRFELKE